MVNKVQKKQFVGVIEHWVKRKSKLGKEYLRLEVKTIENKEFDVFLYDNIEPWKKIENGDIILNQKYFFDCEVYESGNYKLISLSKKSPIILHSPIIKGTKRVIRKHGTRNFETHFYDKTEVALIIKKLKLEWDVGCSLIIDYMIKDFWKKYKEEIHEKYRDQFTFEEVEQKLLLEEKEENK